MKEQTSKKSKNYVLSNNVVINLGNLPLKTRRSSSRSKSPTKPKQLTKPTPTELPIMSPTFAQPVRFSNISNLETQSQQAWLRALENGNRQNIRTPEINSTFRQNATTSPFVNYNDNAGIVSTSGGSESFIDRGNNIPENMSMTYTDNTPENNYILPDDITAVSSLTESSATQSSEQDTEPSATQSSEEEEEEEIIVRTPARRPPASISDIQTPSTAASEIIPSFLKYSRNEVAIWLDNDKQVNPKFKLKTPNKDGREYRTIKQNGGIFNELVRSARYYNML
jgi:hypothetical protein